MIEIITVLVGLVVIGFTLGWGFLTATCIFMWFGLKK